MSFVPSYPLANHLVHSCGGNAEAQELIAAINSSGGGSGTVTSLSIVTANGVSGNVANPTTTPAITLTLGAITPTSVAASGTITGSNFAGGANPSATIGLSAVNGSATTFMTSDSAPPLSQAITPTWTGAHSFTVAPTTNFGVGTSNNTRLGPNTGNNTAAGDFNVCIGTRFVGFSAGQSLTTGNTNILICGGFAMTSGLNNVCLGGGDNITSGQGNLCIGTSSGVGIATQNNNVHVGINSAQFGGDVRNCVGIGTYSLYTNAAIDNIGIGYSAGSGLTSGAENTIIGASAGTTYPSTGQYNTLIGSQTQAAAAGTNYGIAVGYQATCGTNEFALSPYTSVQTFYIYSSTSTLRATANLTITTISNTDASRKYRLSLNAFDTAAREGLRIDANGSVALLGFFGATAVAQQTGDMGTALVNLGLMSGTPTTGGSIKGWRPTNSQSGTTYSLVLGDAGQRILFTNGAAVTLTVTKSSVVAWLVDTEIDLEQYSSGQVTVSPDAGVTINSYAAKTKLAGQYAGATLKYEGSNVWSLIGNLV